MWHTNDDLSRSVPSSSSYARRRCLSPSPKQLSSSAPPGCHTACPSVVSAVLLSSSRLPYSLSLSGVSCPPHLPQVAIQLVPQWCQLSSSSPPGCHTAYPSVVSAVLLISSRLPYSLSLSGVSCPPHLPQVAIQLVPQWCQLSSSAPPGCHTA